MHKLFHSDCISLNLKDLDLIYLDPPFSSVKEDKYFGYGENLDQYISYITARITKLETFANPAGFNILIHLDWRTVHYIKVEADKIFGRDNFRNEIVHCYSSPVNVTRHLPRKHDTILWYGIGDYHFNLPRIPHQGKLKVGGATSWNPKAADEKEYLKRGKPLEDWWMIPSLCRNEKERRDTKYPTQKPIALLKRIVETFSNPGDNVYDPFSGSGTTLAAAIELNRNAFGSDISEKAIKIASTRLEAIVKS
jgi:DNA modification methylase